MHRSHDSRRPVDSDSFGFGPGRARSSYALAVAFVVAVASLLGSCAEQREPIDRVQPNAIKKSELTGDKWYYQRTVVDVPASNGFTFVGNTDHEGLSRIVWDIQENYLYARRSFEFIEGAAKKGELADDFQGEVLAAYRIEKHFDITRAYNQTTGEKLNIREENSVDRPWYDRTHMRVDWSENLVTNYDLNFEAASIEPVPYYVQDKDNGEEHPDAPTFDYENEEENKNLEYFDITNKIHAKGGTIYIRGYGEVPICRLRGQDTTECGAGEYAIRNSFMRLDEEENDYQPKSYKGAVTDKYGYFTTERLTYDERDGIIQQNRKRYLNRFDIWKNWTDEEGNTIPPEQREVDPIVYHVNRNFPADLKQVARETASDWNEIFVDTVEEAGKDLDDDQRMFILCPNNPVREGDPEECGEPGTSPRLGDIRYSFMAYVPKYMEYGLLGLGPANNDPLTGEIISGMAYVYAHNNTAAHRTQDKVQLLNGDLDEQDYLDGVDTETWNDAVNDRTAAENGATGTASTERRQHGLQDAEHMVDSLVNRTEFTQWNGRRQEITEQDQRIMREEGFEEWVDPMLEKIHRQEHEGISQTSGLDGLETFQNTYIEDHLVSDELLIGMGQKPANSAMSASDKQLASPMRGGFIQKAIDRHKLRRRFAMKNNMYLPEMADHGLQGLARELQGEDDDEVYNTIRETVYKSVLTHEVGHSVGLMHNFGASDDAINYRDKYWEIRDDGTVGPRINDPVTEQELNQKIHDYGYTSTMDYTGKMPIGGLGTGKYDRAAIMYGYADQVEVFEDIGSLDASMLQEWHSQDGSVITFQDGEPASIHYTTFYNELGEKLYEDSNRRFVDVDDLKTDEDGHIDWTTAEVDGQEMQRVPYIYCSHTSANLSDHCLTRDYGADSYERMKHTLDNLDTWYITRAFPRGKIGATNFSYIRSQYATFNRLKRWNDLYALYTTDLFPRAFEADTVEDFLTDPEEGWGNKTWAIQNGFNYLIQTMLMPKIGSFSGPYPSPDGGETVRSDFAASDSVDVQGEQIDVTEGRYYSTSWGDGERECGYFWFECLHHYGFYLDKMLAIFALSDTETNFVARSTPEDIRQWEIGYWTTFPEQLSRINESMISEKWGEVAPYFVENNDDPDDEWELQWPNYAGEMDDTHERPVNPAATFTVKLYWQLLGQLRFPDTYDQSFVEESRVWVEGTGQQPGLDDEQKFTVNDPDSNYTYGALDFEDKDGAGKTMLQRASRMRAWTNYCDDSDETETEADDCSNAPLGLTPALRDRYTGQFEDYLELVKVVADVNAVRRYGSPFSP